MALFQSALPAWGATRFAWRTGIIALGARLWVRCVTIGGANGAQFAEESAASKAGVTADAGEVSSSASRSAAVAGDAAESISPATIRFSQSSVNGVEEIAASMRADGWKGAPMDVVRMSDGGLTAFDNTRVLATSRAGINVQAIIRESTEVFPAGRRMPKSGIQPATWRRLLQFASSSRIEYIARRIPTARL